MSLDKETYQETIIRISGQIAEILSRGEDVELSHSRSGIKLLRFKKRHEVLRPDKDLVISQGEGLADGNN